MDVLVERCCGLDVHKDTVVACVRTPGEGGKRQSQVRTFGAMTVDLLALRDWLVAVGVTRVGMESTGVYWKAPFYVLEDVAECWVLNARHMRNVPGRKTDVADAEWICQLVEHGLVRPSFVPPKPIRELRDLTRYRRAQIDERTREAQRLDKVLQDAGIKLSSVASNILGKSGRDMVEALVSGTKDPEVLAELARGRLRAKLPTLQRALEGRFVSHHALIAGEILAKLDYLEEMIGRLNEEVHRRIAPFALEVELLTTVTGVKQRTAECLVAEVGVDMARFGSSARLASWAGACPGNHESGGKSKSGRSRKGSKWLAAALAEAAEAAGHSKGTYLGAQFARLRGRIGHPKARKAVAHSILVAVYHILDQNVPYQELGADWFVKRRPDAHARRLAHQIEALGYRVTIVPIEEAA
jgi:transposase